MRVLEWVLMNGPERQIGPPGTQRSRRRSFALLFRVRRGRWKPVYIALRQAHNLWIITYEIPAYKPTERQRAGSSGHVLFIAAGTHEHMRQHRTVYAYVLVLYSSRKVRGAPRFPHLVHNSGVKGKRGFRCSGCGFNNSRVELRTGRCGYLKSDTIPDLTDMTA